MRKAAFVVVGAALIISGCAKSAPVEETVSAKNVIQLDAKVDRVIGDSVQNYRIIGNEALAAAIQSGSIAQAGSARATAYLSRLADGSAEAQAEPEALSNAAARSSLSFSMPQALLNQMMVFGGVITAVSDRVSEDLGGLKLTDLPPLNVKPVLAKATNGAFALSLLECARDCSAATKAVISFPVTAVDDTNKLVIVDLSPLGQGLTVDLLAGKDNPALAKYKAQISQTMAFDFSQSTLVFDIGTRMAAVAAGATSQLLDITSRWYLKPASVFNPGFVSRAPVTGVGFFETERSPTKLIQRFDLKAGQTVKYFLKNVPPQFQPAFASAFDEWNQTFRSLFGQPVFSYEFVQAGDPKAALLVAGDVRYNLVEWDLVNKASYGGLGPSIANQFSGENFHGNVLIQGPTIIDLYTKWFAVGERARVLRAQGRDAEADAIELAAKRELETSHAPSAAKLTVRLGGDRQLDVRSADPRLEDPLEQRDDFEPLPAGLTFATYMPGYFHDMLTHELGHNLGLRHNFRGNLGAAPGEPALGRVSRSIMEYLGRRFRHLDHVGEYDVMAISYGYGGRLPNHVNWFCTDEDQVDVKDLTKSAECSKDDATPDPFGYWLGQLDRQIALVTARRQAVAPVWTLDDMKKEIDASTMLFASYAGNPAQVAQAYTNFFTGGGRPNNPSAVRAYVATELKGALCDPGISRDVAMKPTADARAKAQANVLALRARYAQALAAVFRPADLACP